MQIYTLSPAATPAPSIDHQALGFAAATVTVDNPTGQWWAVGNPPTTVPPYSTGQIIALPATTQVAIILPVTPPGQVSAPLSGQTATFTYSELALPPNPGYTLAPPSLSQASSVTLATLTGSTTLIGPLPAGTSVLVISSSQVYNNYSLSLQDRNTSQIFYNASVRPQPQFASVPLVPSSDQYYNLAIFNNSPNTCTYTVYAAAGNLPTQVQPLEGFFRTSIEVVTVGYADYDQLTATGDSGTYRWAVQNPANSVNMLILDHGFIQLGQVTGPTNLAVAMTIDTLAGVEKTLLAQILNLANTDREVTGPVPIPPGYQLRGYTQNTSGVTVLLVTTATYHTVPL